MSAKVAFNTEGIIELSGSLQFPTIIEFRQQLETLFDMASGPVQVDFAGVVACDSSALSLWMCCQRYADAIGLSIEAVNLPFELVEFAHLVGLNEQLKTLDAKACVK